jgi:hypothetical protein
MPHRELALEYIQCFAAGDVEGLGAVLAEGLQFRGPYLSVDSKAAYLDALRGDPPEPCEVAILSVTEEEDQVVVFYELLKSGGNVTLAQWFRLGVDGIRETWLVF